LAGIQSEIETKRNGKAKPDLSGDAILQELAGPIIEGFDFEQILKEQGYKGTSTARIRKLIKELDVKDDLDEMLATLSR
jgi:hypothetical protein